MSPSIYLTFFLNYFLIATTAQGPSSWRCVCCSISYFISLALLVPQLMRYLTLHMSEFYSFKNLFSKNSNNLHMEPSERKKKKSLSLFISLVWCNQFGLIHHALRYALNKESKGTYVRCRSLRSYLHVWS